VTEISPRTNVQTYRMRGTDYVECYTRPINGKLYTFSRVRWGSGEVTIRAWMGNTTTVLHQWGLQVS
jgi:hypothetical protein